MEDIILFGTGELLEFYEKIVVELGYKVIGYSDNNSNKWGTFIKNKPVIPPIKLVDYNSKILISAAAEKEISDSIGKLNLKNRLIFHKELEELWIEKNINRWDYLSREDIKAKDKRTIFFDLLSGTGWAGTETWSFKLASGLKENGEEVFLLRKGSHLELDKSIEDMSKRVNYSKLEYFETIDEIVKILVNYLPCVVVNNFSDYMPVAVSIVKKFFPDMIKMVAVSHNYETNEIFKIASRESIFDYIFCVSTKIKESYITKYNIKPSKVLYRETPINVEEYKKEFNTTEALKICYPSRLIVKQKRTDLLEEFIKLLEDKKIEYILNIAGDGPYKEKLEQFIQVNNLGNKVKIHGLLTSKGMNEFLKHQDLYINMSEYEGTCQAMLEAMSYYVVPIVTNVSGVDDFIENKVNGFISKVYDINDMTNNIKWIFENRFVIEKMGKKARDEVASRCKLSDYVEFFEKNILDT